MQHIEGYIEDLEEIEKKIAEAVERRDTLAENTARTKLDNIKAKKEILDVVFPFVL